MSAVEFNWFIVTTWALAAWEKAKAVFWEEMHAARGYPQQEEAAKARIGWARAEYRNRVLSWYRKLCLPLKPGEVTPNEVAKLLAEEARETGNTSGNTCAEISKTEL